MSFAGDDGDCSRGEALAVVLPAPKDLAVLPRPAVRNEGEVPDIPRS